MATNEAWLAHLHNHMAEGFRHFQRKFVLMRKGIPDRIGRWYFREGIPLDWQSRNALFLFTRRKRRALTLSLQFGGR